ncbi:MAG: hypothetical protein CFE44_00420 [Burkholderiales bacterium PBB4]|nr:MAG: hypothetical protein CFE44_00420 [Burkholderiales bacterium PBB4]
MGTKPPTSGLLSKVASIFRASEGREGAAKDAGAEAPDAEDARQSRVGDNEKNALQALIQRKRQDDLVRRREFNYLRKLRKSPVSSGIVRHDIGERPSAFQTSSGFVVDDRASTLRKIDAIEAHMISSWARAKVSSVAPSDDQTMPAPLRSDLPRLTSRTASAPPPSTPAAQDMDNLDLDFTGLLSAQGGTAVDTKHVDAGDKDTVAMPLSGADRPLARENLAPLEFTLTDLPGKPAAPRLPVAVPVAVVQEPLPEHVENALQDAAIQFAEGDSANAEAMLLGKLQDVSLKASSADVIVSALFDLYRATGQQDGFDVVAMDYAERFGRSPGEWFSLPELLQARADAAPVESAAPSQMAASEKVWESPAVLTGSAVAALRAHFSSPKAVWHVDWFALSEIENSAAEPLAVLMHDWCTQAVELHWSGVDSLLRVQQLRTPADDNTVDPLWWKLRLDTLCILDRHDDFESLALDYCVVFEVSPPAWQRAICNFVQDQSLSEFGGLAENPPSAFVDDLAPMAGPYASYDLLGVLVGEPSDILVEMTMAAESADHMVVSCALLVRMDFSAAGALLNWAIDREAHGCQIQLVQVPRLVAVFFQMLGIDRHAKILVRAN